MLTKRENELWQLKCGMAVIGACIVEALQDSDPAFKERFLEKLDTAQDNLRNSTRENEHALEALNWTRQFLAGWNIASESNDTPRTADKDR